MSSIINTNVLSLSTQNNLNKSQVSLNNAIERLSSGMRINSASDDTANSGTGTYSGVAQSVTGFTATGLVNNESASVLAGVSTSGGSGTNAGSYTSTASGTASNYSLTFNTGALTISQRPITLTADDKTKAFGATDPALTYQITTGNLVTGDTFTGALTRATGENVGSYTINANALANSNYLIAATNGTLSIESSVELDNAIQSAKQQISSGTNISLSGGLVFVQVPDDAANTPTATGSARFAALTADDVEALLQSQPTASGSVGGEALAALPSSDDTDSLGFMRVVVVGGGINLGPSSEDLKR